MQKKFKIRKGDKVIITAGKSKGIVGEVLKVLPNENKAMVRGANIVKRHTKPSQNSTGGIVEKEALLHISNIAYYDEKKQKASRIGFKILEDGRKVRISKLTSEVIDK
ncbi:MAG: 50S ribosomal protein L24 [Pelagibacterales bacterium]|nr:50S ribosomal protein L24 [Pelagibacterales bacterium]OUU62141.1 MAG: 50S ribosomal protein L24 [Alphaproteobacteria bacterium TMED62]|tara:strand:- start:16121 stop:16444 length:324 start_codon:yes stop_codon:yes gene_type:complete